MLAIIGGSGFTNLTALQIVAQDIITTPFGNPSGPIIRGRINDKEILFLARHGPTHSIPPHQINYRANLWALQACGAKKIIGIAAVGGISQNMSPQTLVIPDQIIDYTYNRPHTFFEQEYAQVKHIDFTYPYCEELRQELLAAAAALNLTIVNGGTYGATQGPRLETINEIQRMQRDGCDIVGMTGMPEAALARELEHCYACCAVVVNWAAGKSAGIVEMAEIEHNLHYGMERVKQLLVKLIAGAA